jgi:hypothetical protein
VSFVTDPDFVMANVPRLSGVAARAVVKGSTLRVNLSCSKGVTCTGTAAMSANVGTKGSEHSALIAKGSFALPAGTTRRVSLPLTVAGLRALGENPKGLAAKLTLSLLGGKKATYRVELP